MESPFRTDEGIVSFLVYLVVTLAGFGSFLAAFLAIPESDSDISDIMDPHMARHFRVH